MTLLQRVISKLSALLLALSILFAIVWLGYSTVQQLKIEPQIEADASDQVNRLERAAMVQISPQDLDKLKTFKSRVLLGQAPAPVLAAELQARLRILAQGHGVEVVQASELSPQEDQKTVSEIGLKLDMTGPSAGVLSFVKDIESFEPWLRIGSATMRSGFIDTAPLQAEPAMTASLEIWGYAQSAVVSPGAGP